MVVGCVVLVAISVVGYALNLVSLARLVAVFVETFEPPIYEHVVEYSERAQWFAITLRINRVWELLYRLVVLLCSFISPHFKPESVYMSRVTVRCLKYGVVCTCFAYARKVICKLVTQPGWGHWQVEICSLYSLLRSAVVVLMYGNEIRCLVTSVEAWVVFAEFDCVTISVMVLCDQPWLAFVYYDCLFSDQVILDVQEKHGVVRFHSECTYMKIEIKKAGWSNSPSRFFTMLGSLA